MSDNQELAFPLPHRTLRPGDVLTEEDIATLLSQRLGLTRRNRSRKQHAEMRRPLVHWYYQMIHKQNPEWNKTAIVTVMGRTLNLSVRTIHQDLSAKKIADQR